jgi:hypothetical protein
MKILIQEPDTKRFLRASGRWAAGPDGAADFKTAGDALMACQKHRIGLFQLVLRFNNPTFDVTLNHDAAEKLAHPLYVESPKRLADRVAQ